MVATWFQLINNGFLESIDGVVRRSAQRHCELVLSALFH
jgi:hypothetical protein